MSDERAREKRRRNLGLRVVAVLPHPAVECVHETRRTGQDSDRHSATDDFAVRREIRANSKDGLHTPRMHPKTRDDLIEHECCP